jgi:Protein of unknown function (DUF3592)
VSALPENYATSTGAPPSPPPAAGASGRLGFAVACIAGGAFVMCFAFFGCLWPTYRVKYVYVPTTAEVLDSRITQRMYKPSRGQPYPMSCPQVRIRYVADGHQYESWIDVYYFPEETHDPAKAAAVRAQFKPGTSVPAWYDPDEPYHAVVTQEYRSWSGGLALAVIGAMCFFLAVFPYFGPGRSRKPQRDNPEATIDRGLPRTEEVSALPENYATFDRAPTPPLRDKPRPSDLYVRLALSSAVIIGLVTLHYGIRSWFPVFLIISIYACVTPFLVYRYISAWRSRKARRDHLETTNDHSPQSADDA